MPGIKPAPSIAAKLQREVDNLDSMLAELAQGCTDQRHFDALEERAQGIAARIRAAFRSR